MITNFSVSSFICDNRYSAGRTKAITIRGTNPIWSKIVIDKICAAERGIRSWVLMFLISVTEKLDIKVKRN